MDHEQFGRIFMKKLQSVALALCCLTLVLLICGANATFAQEVTATVAGTVTDPSGAAVVGATVTAKSVERGITYTGVSNDSGIYRIAQLPVGSYDLRIEKTGFQTAVYPTFTLSLNQIARFDVELKVGQVSQTIEVTGAAPVLKTEATQVDTIINAATNDNLPLGLAQLRAIDVAGARLGNDRPRQLHQRKQYHQLRFSAAD